MKLAKYFKNALMITVMMGATAAQAQVNWVGTYVGVDENNNACQVRVTDYENWVSIKLISSSGNIDQNVVTPLASTPTQNGECSILADSRKDTTIVGENYLIQRTRLIEFVVNWIQEMTIQFDQTQLTDVQFKVGETRSTGPGACSALRKNKLQQKLSCLNLKKM